MLVGVVLIRMLAALPPWGREDWVAAAGRGRQAKS